MTYHGRMGDHHFHPLKHGGFKRPEYKYKLIYLHIFTWSRAPCGSIPHIPWYSSMESSFPNPSFPNGSRGRKGDASKANLGKQQVSLEQNSLTLNFLEPTGDGFYQQRIADFLRFALELPQDACQNPFLVGKSRTKPSLVTKIPELRGKNDRRFAS